MATTHKPVSQPLEAEVERFRERMRELQETIRAIRAGEVDALVISGEPGERVYTLQGAEHPYRILIESISEGAANVSEDGTVLYSNRRFAHMLEIPLERLIGSRLQQVAPITHETCSWDQLLQAGVRASRQQECSLPTARGDSVPVLISVAPYCDGAVQSVCVIATDLRDSKEKQKQLEQSSEAVRAVLAQTLRAEQAARMAEEMIQSFMDYSPSAVFMKDEQGRYVFVNQAFEHELNITAKEVLGRTTPELWFPKETLQRLLEADRTVLRENRPVFSVGSIPSRDGTIHEWASTKFPFRDSAGNRFVGGISTDVSHQKRFEEALRRNAALLDMVHDAIIVRDLSGVVTFWNRGAEEMYGWTSAEATGKVCHSLLKTEFPRPLPELLAETFRTGRWRGEVVHTTKDGRRMVCASRWALHRDPGGTPDGVLQLNTDTTNRRMAEEALQRANETLHAEIVQRARAEKSLHELSARLLRLQDEERRKIARDLHDSTSQLLSGIAMKLALISQAIDKEGSAKIRQLICQTQSLADQASREIRDLSHLLHPPNLDLVGLCGAVEAHVEQFTETTGIRVRLDVPDNMQRLPPEAELALFRIVQESLTNVQRHSGSKTAKLGIWFETGQIYLEVKDSGRGPRPRSRDREADSGIGIAGMRERLGQLGGSLKVSSTSRGTTILATLPLNRSDKTPAS